MRRILLLLTVATAMVAAILVLTGPAFAKVNPCPPQQQGDLDVCTRGGSGEQGGGSGGLTETDSTFFPIVSLDSYHAGGGANPGDAPGGGGGRESADLTLNPFTGLQGGVEASGGQGAPGGGGGGHCGATFEGGQTTGSFVHGKSCP
jgi:hypothetical protein